MATKLLLIKFFGVLLHHVESYKEGEKKKEQILRIFENNKNTPM